MGRGKKVGENAQVPRIREKSLLHSHFHLLHSFRALYDELEGFGSNPSSSISWWCVLAVSELQFLTCQKKEVNFLLQPFHFWHFLVLFKNAHQKMNINMYINNFTNQLTKFIVATVSKQCSITDKCPLWHSKWYIKSCPQSRQISL